MWMPSSVSMWFGGGQKLFSTTSNQPGVDWDKGFPTIYFLNTMHCTLQCWILNLVHMYFKKILSPQHRKRISDSWECVQPRRPRGSGGDSVDKMPLGVLVHLSLPRRGSTLQTTTKLLVIRQVDPILLLLCILCENDMILNQRWADEAYE